MRIAFVGFGEAGTAFAAGVGGCGYDRKTDDPAHRLTKLADFDRAGVNACATLGEALDGATVVLSLVTADQALAVARAGASQIGTGALWLDMNSVAPDTKRAAAEVIERAGARYIDVAVMAPVDPAGRDVPMLVSGPHTDDALAALAVMGFANARAAPGARGSDVGAAAAIKMIRSVMVKGIEALSAECFLAAEAAGVADAVIASLDASWPWADWRTRIAYNLDRMTVHGLRRAAEMEEAVKTLDALGTGSVMTRGTVARQRAMGGQNDENHQAEVRAA